MQISQAGTHSREFEAIRLSWSLFMGDFLHVPEMPFLQSPQVNMPEHPEPVIIFGRELAGKVLEPLIATFGAVQISRGYLAPALFDALNHRNVPVDTFRVWGRAWGRVQDQSGAGTGKNEDLRAGVRIRLPWLMDHEQPEKAACVLILWIKGHLPVASVQTGASPGELVLSWSASACPVPSLLDPHLFTALSDSLSLWLQLFTP